MIENKHEDYKSELKQNIIDRSIETERRIVEGIGDKKFPGYDHECFFCENRINGDMMVLTKKGKAQVGNKKIKTVSEHYSDFSCYNRILELYECESKTNKLSHQI